MTATTATAEPAATARVQIDRRELHRALLACTGVVERRATIPILGNVRLTQDADGLHLLATDMDIDHTITLPLADPGHGAPLATTVVCHAVTAFVGELGSDRAELELDGDRLTVRDNEGCDAQWPTLPVADFPTRDAPTGAPFAALDLTARELADWWSPVTPCISTEDTRYYLNGIALEIEPARGATGRLVAVATDGHRLACCHGPSAPAQWSSVIVPRAAVHQTLRRLADQGDDTPVRLSLHAPGRDATPNRIMLEFGRERVVAKLVDGTFPDWRRVVPPKGNAPVELDVPRLRQSLRRVRAVVGPKAAARIQAEGAGMTVSGRTADGARVSDRCPAAATVPTEWDAGFRVSYLLDAIRDFGLDRLRMHVSGAESPARFDIPPDVQTDREMFVVLMPMRV